MAAFDEVGGPGRARKPRGRQIWHALVASVLIGVLMQVHAWGAFHLWDISEIYSNADGSVQFIEMFCASSSQNFISGHQLVCRKGAQTHTFVIPNNVSGSTVNKFLLFATPGFAALPGGITPDFTIPTNFLFSADATLSFEGADTVSYQRLPDNGLAALVRSGTAMVFNATNSPRNFAGASGSLNSDLILSAQRVQDKLIVSFVSFAGRTYRLESSEVLATSVWPQVQVIAGDGTLKRTTNSTTARTAFFRLRRE